MVIEQKNKRMIKVLFVMKTVIPYSKNYTSLQFLSYFFMFSFKCQINWRLLITISDRRIGSRLNQELQKKEGEKEEKKEEKEEELLLYTIIMLSLEQNNLSLLDVIEINQKLHTQGNTRTIAPLKDHCLHSLCITTSTALCTVHLLALCLVWDTEFTNAKPDTHVRHMQSSWEPKHYSKVQGVVHQSNQVITEC